MLIRNGIEYSSIIRNGLEYNSLIRNGIEYASAGSAQLRPETQAILDYASINGLAPISNIDAFNTFIGGLVDSGIALKLDNLYVFMGDGSEGFKTINLINPELFKASLVGGVGNRNNGFYATGVARQYVNTNTNLTFNTSKYTSTNFTRGYFITQRSLEYTEYYAGSTTDQSAYNARVLIQGTTYRDPSGGTSYKAVSVGSETSTGLIYTSRVGTTAYTGYKEVLTTSTAYPTTSYVNTPHVLLSLGSTQGTHYPNHLDSTLGAHFVGAYLTPAEMITLRGLLTDLSTALGVNIEA